VRHSERARSVLEEADEALALPLSRWIEEGPADVLRQTRITQPAVLAATIAIYIVLGVLYESFIHPLTILSTLPSAGVGALLVDVRTR